MSKIENDCNQINRLESYLSRTNISLYTKYMETRQIVKPILLQYKVNFPEYTDHSIEHSDRVGQLASDLLSDIELKNLNSDEIYILLMACCLHDIGMCIPESQIDEIRNSSCFKEVQARNQKISLQDYIRDIHHQLSNDYILKKWKELDIPTQKYAEAIACIARAHRKEDLMDFRLFDPKYFVKSGREFVCLPYLGCILRIGDEIDITNRRVPDFLFTNYLPDNETSRKEWEKMNALTQVNVDRELILVEGKCTNESLFNAVNQLCNKIQKVLDDCHKVLRYIGNTGGREFFLTVRVLKNLIKPENFIPKNIQFNLDTANIINTFIGEKLYRTPFVALREVLQNAIDTCHYRKIIEKSYSPRISIIYDNDKIIIKDNGMGMDDFIVENYFAKLASSYYQSKEIKEKFESIGQFGIGVLSYFLICDSFAVKTRMQSKPALFFTVNKDPGAFFNFHPQIADIELGTEIILNLKDEFGKEINFAQLVSTVRFFVRNNDIPIQVLSGELIETINHENYSKIENFELERFLKYQSLGRVDQYRIFSVSFDTEDFQGVCGIISNADIPNYMYLDRSPFKDDVFFDNLFYGFQETSFNDRKIGINISCKGIYVQTVPGTIFINIIGRIDLKRNIGLKLNREQIFDFDLLFSYIQFFECEFIKKIYKEIPKTDRLNIGYRFIEHSTGTTQTLIDVYKNCIELLVFDQDFKHLTIGSLFSNFDRFIIFFHNFKDLIKKEAKRKSIKPSKINLKLKIGQQIKSLYDSIKIPILYLLDRHNEFEFFIETLTQSEGLKIEIFFFNSKPHLLVNCREKNNEWVFVGYYPAVQFNSPKIIAFIEDHVFFNLDHPLVKFYLNEKEKNHFDPILNELFDDLNYELRNYSDNERKINDLLSKINQHYGTTFILTKNDF